MPYGIIKIDTVTFTNAGVDKSVTLSGLVQNPVFSGNVTVTGTLSGVTVTGTTANFTSGNFTNISGGTHTITSGVFAAGSAASPSITFTGDLNTGIYSPGADQVAISTGGSGRLFVDASGNIKVGTGPGQIGLLDVRGNVVSFTNFRSYVSSVDAANTRGFRQSIDGGELLAFYHTNTAAVFEVNASERLRITSAGLVGVGVSSPQLPLTIGLGGGANPATSGSTQSSGGIARIGSSGAATLDIGTLAAGPAWLQATNVTNLATNYSLLFNPNGGNVNIGPGTTSPARLLHISDTAGQPAIKLSNNTSGHLSGDGADITFTGTDLFITNREAGAIIAEANGSERLRITSAGLVGVGTSSPSYPFHIANGAIGVTSFSNSIDGAGEVGLLLRGQNGSHNTSLLFSSSNTNFRTRQYFNVADGSLKWDTSSDGTTFSERLRITSAGLVGVGTSTFASGAGQGTGVSAQINGSLYLYEGNNAANNGGAIAFGVNALPTNTPMAQIKGLLEFAPGSELQGGIGIFTRPTAGGASGQTLQQRVTINAGGNVGIGTTSPGTYLDTRGFASYRGNAYTIASFCANNTLAPLNICQSENGTAPAISAGQNSTGTYQPLVLMTSELKRVLIDSSGNVGIGTTSPSYLLDVISSASSTIRSASSETSGSSIGQLVAEYAGSGGTNAQLTVRAGASYGLVGTVTNSPLLFAANGSERARIDSSGRLLVGTSTAYAVTSGFSGVTQQIVGNDAASFLRFSADASHETLWLCKSRNATAGQHTVLQSNDGIARFNFQGSDGTNFVTAARIDAEVDGTPGSTVMPGRLVFSTTSTTPGASPTERMRITNDGSVLLNTGGSTIEVTTGTVDGAYYNSPAKQLVLSRDGGGSLTLRRRSSDGTIQGFYRDGTVVGTISVTTTATAYNTSSDYRLKENVAPVTDGITRLQQLKPSRFNFIADPSKTVDGFIAHEAQAVVPECVTGEKDAVDGDGNPQYQGIDQSKLVPLLTAALQEAVAKIESLEARLTAAGI